MIKTDEINKELINKFKIIYKKWQTSPYIQDLIKNWLLFLVKSYSQDTDFLYHKSKKEYINEYMNALLQVKTIDIWDAFSVLKNKNSLYYKGIKKIPEGYSVDPFWIRLSKKVEDYAVDEEGEYYFSCHGYINSSSNNYTSISLLKQKYEIDSSFYHVLMFHHELTHICQKKERFFYPTMFPFSKAIRNILIEGDAKYNEKLCDSKIDVNTVIIDEENIKEDYNFYYQLYVHLIHSLPLDFRNKWRNGIFDLSSFTNEEMDYYGSIFALLTIFSLKASYEQYDDNRISMVANSFSMNYKNNIKSLNSQMVKITEKENNLKKEIELYEKLLEDSTLLEFHYQKERRELEKFILGLPLEIQQEKLKLLKDKGNILAYNNFVKEELDILYVQLNATDIEKRKYQAQEGNFMFGNTIVKYMKQFMMQQLSLQELFQIYKSKTSNKEMESGILKM